MSPTTGVTDTGERRARKLARGVRWGEVGKVPSWQLAGPLPNLVIFHPRREGVVKAQQVVTAWLEQVGLHLKPSKTHMTQTLTSSQERGGVDFLGCTIRQHRVGKTHCRWQHGKPLGFKTIITPSSTSIQKHRKDLSRIIRANRAAPQPLLIDKLNPVIHGW